MAIIIDGKKIAAELRAECIARTNRLLEKGIKPRLDVIIVGSDPASQQYVNSRAKDSEWRAVFMRSLRKRSRRSLLN